jgi:FKBP-type peptidyl-prolyl cis-trans isomerase (trigger factor)
LELAIALQKKREKRRIVMLSSSEVQGELLSPFSLNTAPLSSHLLKATVIVSADIVQRIRNQTLEYYQQHISLPGFKKNAVPKEYLEKYYHEEIYGNIRGLLFSHLVLTYTMEELARRKILLVNVPRLTNIKISPYYTAHYTFDISTVPTLNLKEWKHFIFKSPKRKNYKDLDKQVTSFIKREQSAFKKQNPDIVEENDWVCFSAHLLNNNNQPILTEHTPTYWLKIVTSTLSYPLPLLFLKAKVGDTFISKNLKLEEAFFENSDNDYSFLITLKSIIKGLHLSLESFKANFKLKSKADVHKKLIEVFSYRNDLSQRKSIIEEIFHLFLSKHRFEVPKHIVIRKQEDILLSLMRQPDYHVYKTHKNFRRHVEMLAEKQLKEEILIDQIAFNENIQVEEKDVQNYLNLFNNERLKEFVYFKPPQEKMENSEVPLHPSILKQAVLREKTLNYTIHVLTK